MDIQTLQAIATIVNSIGLPATAGVLAIIAAWNFFPIIAELLRAKIEVNKATNLAVRQANAVNIVGQSASIDDNKKPGRAS